ncbi:hypothetical protein HHL24_19575 [Paraburkholderia sp. RP-4-7]|uniref:Zinc-binding dehydrogenase n=1 Tax=Paraburkholderia polaris TaxID=2728848 RepID=A0A848IIV1_9BURK|nr:hypothetical protein [Paraburkholderia polaris]NMM00129.1 hypothetical protein [Paraburkholderia polaris]
MVDAHQRDARARNGVGKPVVDTAYAFDELPAALAHLERGAFGKLVVKVGG